MIVLTCPDCGRELVIVPGGAVCEHCNDRIRPLPRVRAYDWSEENRAIRDAHIMADELAKSARKKVRQADWPTIRKAMGL